MRFAVLGSGSRGNATLVEGDGSSILIDAGFSCAAIGRRLEAVGHPGPAALEGILITHEHSDHVRGLSVLLRRCDAPVYCNRETFGALREADPSLDRSRFRLFVTGRQFEIGTFGLLPFSLPHDAMDPVGFRVENGAGRLAVVTDLGRPTHLVNEHLRGCQAVVVEFNHEPALLQASRRPWALKQRILSPHGHLSNADAGVLLAGIASADLAHVVLAHLSAECNRPDTALEYAQKAVAASGDAGPQILVAAQDTPTPPLRVAAPDDDSRPGKAPGPS